MYRIHLSADFETEEAAKAGLSDAEEAVGKRDGDVLLNEIEDLDGEES